MPRKMDAKRRRAAHHKHPGGRPPDLFFEQSDWQPGSYLFEQVVGDQVEVKKAGIGNSRAVRLPRRCFDCDLTDPLCRFAPVFNNSPLKTGESLVLLCWDCYNRRADTEEAQERMRWLERDSAIQARNRARSQRFYDTHRRKAG
jgi:hypothetical protein